MAFIRVYQRIVYMAIYVRRNIYKELTARPHFTLGQGRPGPCCHARLPRVFYTLEDKCVSCWQASS